MLIKLFPLLGEKSVNLRTELLAGLTTFLTMAYIIAINPSILSEAGMDAGALNMFHNSGNQDILPVADCIDLQLGPHQVFVDQDGIFYFVFKDNLHIFMDIRIMIRYDHVLAAEYIAWTHQNGVSQPVCRRNCLILRINGIARGLFHIEFFQ